MTKIHLNKNMTVVLCSFGKCSNDYARLRENFHEEETRCNDDI